MALNPHAQAEQFEAASSRTLKSMRPWARQDEGEDILFACSGDNLTLEVLAAAALLRVEAPDWCVRVMHVTDLLVLGIPQKYPLLSTNRASTGCFPFIAHVFNFHEYTAAIKQLLRERPYNHIVRHVGEESV